MVSNHIWFWCSKPESFFGAAFFGCQPAKPSDTDPVQLPVVFWLLALRMLGSIEDFSRSVWAMRHGSKMNKTDVSKCICSPCVNRAIPRQQPTKINSNKNIPSSFGRFPNLVPSIYRQNHLNKVSTLHLKINDLNFEHVVRSLCISSCSNLTNILLVL